MKQNPTTLQSKNWQVQLDDCMRSGDCNFNLTLYHGITNIQNKMHSKSSERQGRVGCCDSRIAETTLLNISTVEPTFLPSQRDILLSLGVPNSPPDNQWDTDVSGLKKISCALFIKNISEFSQQFVERECNQFTFG